MKNTTGIQTSIIKVNFTFNNKLAIMPPKNKTGALKPILKIIL